MYIQIDAWLVSTYDYWSFDRLNFMVFNSVWSLLVLAYVGIVPIYMTGWFHKLAALVLNSLTTIFWFAGSIALAVATPSRGYYDNGWIHTMRASVAFGFFLWALFMFLTVLDALESLRSRGHNVPDTHKKGPSAYPGA